MKLNIKTQNNDRFDNHKDGAEKLPCEVIFKTMKQRLIDEANDMLKHKKSMKLKLGINFKVGRHIDIDPFNDTNEPNKKDSLKQKDIKHSYVKDIKELIWSTKYEICTKANMIEILDELYGELYEKLDELT